MKKYELIYEYDSGMRLSINVEAEDFWSAYQASVEWVIGILGARIASLKEIECRV